MIAAATESEFELSEVRLAAIECTEPPLILGGPGSGKTTLALLRAKEQISTLKPGQSVLFLSFSRSAVKQVSIRCKDVLDRSDRESIEVRTYHAFCLDLIKSHGLLLSGSVPRILFPGQERVAKSKFDGDWDIERARLAESGVYAFDEFAGAATKLLANSAALRDLIANRYPLIVIDEFQDTDTHQWELVQLLAQGSKLTFLADADQHIYDFNDQCDANRLNHLREVMSPPEFDLEGDNHRSPSSDILTFANAVLRYERRPDEIKDVIEKTFYENQLPSLIHVAVRALKKKLRERGVENPAVAIFSRANPAVADLSNMLFKPATANGRELTPLDHDIAIDETLTIASARVIASMLEWSASGNAEESARSTLEAIGAYFETKASLKDPPGVSALKLSASFLTNAGRIGEGKEPRSNATKGLLALARIGLEFSGEPESDWRLARNSLSAIKGLEEVAVSARMVRSIGASEEIGRALARAWRDNLSYPNAIGLVVAPLEQRTIWADDVEPNGLTLMTLHKSKGKEFDGVILVERTYSSKFFMPPTDHEEPQSASRRLIRVGLTRARHIAVVLRPTEYLPFFRH